MKVLITGPESSGKSTLARALAWCLDGVYVAEQARAYLNDRRGIYGPPDLPRILDLQLTAEERAEKSGAALLFCDTGPEVIRIWSEVKYGTCDPAILDACRSVDYDLTILCAPDLPWEYDTLREHPTEAQREELFARYRSLLPAAAIVSGDERTATAINLLRAYL